ncbi:MAG: hypothetical protein M0Q29_10690 [Thiopseudomonas sp.]|nr:hypothetical protein [Thiopseudomonas sp.]
MTPPFLPRLLRQRVLEALTDTPVVCLLGPRQVGKSTLAQHIDAGRSYLSLDDSTLLQAARQGAGHACDSGASGSAVVAGVISGRMHSILLGVTGYCRSAVLP